MPFMQRQVTEKQVWYQADTPRDGIVSIPASMFGPDFLVDQYGVDPNNVESIEGYGVRLSAPGYMDCTEWAVFDTQDQAEEYLEEYYGDEEDE